MHKRRSDDPKRRITPLNSFSAEEKRVLLAGSRYVGSALHKRHPSNYGFQPPVNPRPTKAMCDDIRSIALEEAQCLFISAVEKGMVSIKKQEGLPKYVWSVDDQNEVYEAKLGNGGYHGYRLSEENEDAMRKYVLHEWNIR